MKQITCFLISLVLIISCQKSKQSYELDAVRNATKILKQAEETVLKDPKVLSLQKFENMDSIKFRKVYDDIITVTAEFLYVADIATYLTPDCLTQPSEVDQHSPKFEIAIKDSIYHAVLLEKLGILKASSKDKVNNFSRIDFLIYQEQLKRISKELRSFCSEEVIENLEDWRSRLPENLNK